MREESDRGIDRRTGRVEQTVDDLRQARTPDLRLVEALRETQLEQSRALEDIDEVAGGIAIAVEGHTRALRDHTDMLTAQGEKLASLEVTVVDFRSEVAARFGSVDTRFDSVDSRLDSVDSRLDSVDSRLDSMDGKLSQVIDLLGGLG